MELPEEADWLQLTPISSQPFSLPPHQRVWSPLHQDRSVLMLSPSSNIRSANCSWRCWLRFWSTYPLGKASLYPSDAIPANNGIYWPSITSSRNRNGNSSKKPGRQSQGVPTIKLDDPRSIPMQHYGFDSVRINRVLNPVTGVPSATRGICNPFNGGTICVAR